MKNEKNYMGFHIPKVWQILKRFAGVFRWAQTSYFWREVGYYGMHYDRLGYSKN